MKFKLLISMAVFVMIAGVGWGQNYTWKSKANFPGVERWGSIAFSIGQTGYMGGGYNLTNKNDFWAYDPTTNTWMQKSNLPVSVRIASAFVINNLGYFVGGILPGGNMNPTVYEYDPTINQWSVKSTFPLNPRYGMIAFTIGSKAYLGLGNSGLAVGPFHDDLFEYDPVLNQWSSKATFPGLVRYGAIAISNDTVGFAGLGFTEPTLGNLIFHNDWWKYNPVTDSWTSLASLPGPARDYPAIMYLDGTIYLGTGLSAGNNYLNDFFKYNPATNQWTAMPAFPGSSRFVTSFFTINNSAYWCAGTNNSTSFNDLWEYSPDSVGAVICFTLKPDAATGKDALVLSGLPNTNTEPVTESIAVAWTCGGNPCVDRALIEFDLTQIPIGSTIISAYLNLYAHPNPITVPTAMSGTNNTVLIQRITSSWSENTVTWNTQPTTTMLNQVILSHTSNPNQNYLNTNVKNLVQDMIDYPNSYGFMLRLQNEVHYNAKDFASSDHPDPSYHPSIEVCYIAPTGIVSNAFQPSVFVYPNPVTDFLYLESTDVSEHIQSVTVYDETGRVVLNESPKLKINFLRIDCLKLVNGFYFVQFKTVSGTYIRKIVKI